jgi:uncharacterized protein (UPF0218 family)
MSVDYVVTPEVLTKFKEPFGVLIEGTFSEAMEKLNALIKKENPIMIISVVDTVSRNLHKHNIIPKMSITDNQSMRQKLEPQTFPNKTIVKAKNPQGTITQEAIIAIKAAFKSKKQVQILVEGEEDLLTLIVVLYAPENSLVVYGQPNKGLVVIKVTPNKRDEAKKIWKIIELTKK